MKSRSLLFLVFVFCISLAFIFNQFEFDKSTHETGESEEGEGGEDEYSGPEQFALFHKAIRTPEGSSEPQYAPGFKMRELQRARNFSQARKKSNARTQSTNGVLAWTERGPANVPGRTRGIIIDPDDAAKNTWFVGSAGGGVWKTTNAGTNWTLITPELSNLATTVLAMAPSNHNTIYLGTGEGFGNLDGVSGNGMFKSTDRGQTWNYLANTSGFGDINRAAVDPNNPNGDIVVVATNSGIYKTINGGGAWTQVSSLSNIQDLRATPGNFNIQYAARDGVGVLKSINAGASWTSSSTGMSANGRIEIAVSPVNPNRIFASAEGALSGTASDLYLSSDAGVTWSLIDVKFNGTSVDFLGGQGWYDNTIACDPFNADIVYVGGVNIFKIQLTSGSSSVNSYTIEQNGTTFMSLINFAGTSAGGLMTVGTTANESVEIRFGTGMTQKAHRFLVPDGSSSGVPDANYSYADYVDVPFQVWDVTNNRQLMVSFRDQNRNGQFELRPADGTPAPPANDQSREYIFVHDITYSTAESPTIAVNGGHINERIYFFWPVLAAGKTWPADIVDSNMKIVFSSLSKLNATTITATDAYGNYDSKNRFTTFGVDIHPDQHNIVMIPMSGSTYKILVANDGGLFQSNTSATPGTSQGDWTMSGKTYNTNQFYGADKRPGKDEYFGGMQDNGTWRSPANESSSSATNYIFAIGGDGFEAIWNNLDGQKLIGGSQGNVFRKSVDGGNNWVPATTGLSGTHPFISKLANSKDNPDRIYTLSSAGVFRSTDFGDSWTLTAITDKWGPSSSLMDVEVSRANANIVWAGSGMVSTGTLRNIHVSTNGGVTFNPTENSPLISGGITKLASHPFEKNTAYALFSQAKNPKILRTTDLGQTWNDISGFGSGDVSTNNFPDVAVYCLYVRPDNPDIIWAGTEIGIVESLDNGQTWALIDDFPNVSVWDMKGQDNQVVIATHGRGIWTATIDEPQLVVKTPEILRSGTSPKEKLLLEVKIEEEFDSIEFYINNIRAGFKKDVDPSQIIVSLNGITPGIKIVKLIAYKGTAPFHSKNYSIEQFDILSVENTYSTYFATNTDLTAKGFTLQTTTGAPVGNLKSMQTAHPYAHNTSHTISLRHPVKVSASFPMLFYSDVAIVEPGAAGSVFGTPEFNDYVVVEASKNGLDWLPLADGYNAQANSTWNNAFNTSVGGTMEMFVNHELNLDNTFNAGDTLLFRYRLAANQTVNGWGAAIQYINIQQEPTAVEKPISGVDKMNLFPNPTTGTFTYEFELTSPTEVFAEVVDLFGRRMISKNLGQKDIGVYRESFDLSNAPHGSYLVILKTGKDRKIKKIIVSR